MKISYLVLISLLTLTINNDCAASSKVYSLAEVSYNNSIAYDKKQNLPITGRVTEHSDTGILLSETSYKNGKKDGVALGYFDSGALLIERHFKAGVIVDKVKMYYESGGGLAKEQTFANGKMNGLEIRYYPTGKIRQETMYKNGKPVSGYNYSEQGEKTVLLK